MKKRFTLILGMVLLLLALAACGGESPTPTPQPEAEDEETTLSNSVSVSDQALGEDNTVTVDSVTSAVDGWMVIHADAEGSPGPVIGHAPVAAGENSDVVVEVDPAAATETLYAMLHVDAGTAGEYEFPGDDGPATDAEGNVVTPAFQVELPMAENSVSISDQALGEDNTVTVDSVTAAVDGWMVIHADAEGSPGPVIGHAPVAAGENSDVVVEVDPAAATETLYAMLHVDAGTAGEYEFPGDDGPATDAEGNVVTPAFQVELPMAENSVSVSDQALGEDNTVTVDSVTAAVDGWMVIHADAEGSPGPVIGHAPVAAGENSDVVVEVDPAGATETLYAMLHVDAGTAGEYEFPGDDGPATDAEGNVVTPSFTLLPPGSVLVGGNDELGDFLVAANGMTLYLFENDEENVSNCYDTCAENWPPFTVEEGQMPVAGDGVTGQLGTIMRDDGTVQVTYNGMPLYFWASDEEPGDATGHGVGDVWFVVTP